MNQHFVIPVSPGELIDKITILEIKREFIKNSTKLKNVKLEYVKAHTNKNDIHSIGNMNADILAKNAVKKYYKL